MGRGFEIEVWDDLLSVKWKNIKYHEGYWLLSQINRLIELVLSEPTCLLHAPDVPTLLGADRDGGVEVKAGLSVGMKTTTGICF